VDALIRPQKFDLSDRPAEFQVAEEYAATVGAGHKASLSHCPRVHFPVASVAPVVLALVAGIKEYLALHAKAAFCNHILRAI